MRWLTIVWYACAALLLFLIFLYLTLPYDAIGRWLLRRAEATTGVHIDAVSVERLHPLGLRWRGVTLSAPDGTEWISFSSVSVDPVLVSLWSRRKVAQVNAELSAGAIEGQVGVEQPQSSDGLHYRIDLTRIDGLDAANFQPLLPGVQGLNGRLSGNLSYDWAVNEPLYGTGTLFMTIEQLMLGGEIMQRLQVPLEQIEFARATCGLSLTQGRAQLSNCTATGPMGEVVVSGMAQLQEPIVRSALALRAQVSWQGLTPAGGPPMTAVISGPLGDPQIRLENVQFTLPAEPMDGGQVPSMEAEP